MKYTGQDVRNALLATDTDADAKVQEMQPLQYLCMMADDVEVGKEMFKMYQAGTKTLKRAKLVTTNDRYDITIGVGYDVAADKLISRGVLSPVIEVMNGWAGTNQMCVVYALIAK